MGLQHRAALAASLLLSFGVVDRAAAADVLHLNWDDSCGSSCFNSHGAYSLTFSASSFSGPVDISKLLLDRRVLGGMAGSFFTVSFQLGGHQVGNWGQWNMGAVGGDEFSLSGSELMWNPADGDLVLVLQIVGANGQIAGDESLGGGFFAAPPEDPPPHQDPPPGGGAGPDTGSFEGDLTEGLFPPIPPLGDTPSDGDTPPNGDGLPKSDDPPANGGFTLASAAPEPAGWALMIGGFAMTGAALRRRKSAAAVA